MHCIILVCKVSILKVRKLKFLAEIQSPIATDFVPEITEFQAVLQSINLFSIALVKKERFFLIASIKQYHSFAPHQKPDTR